MALLILFFHGPLVTERVELNTFAPVHLVHYFDLAMFAVLAFFLFTNAFRMCWFVMHEGRGAGILDIIRGFKEDGFGYIRREEEKVKIPLTVFLSQVWIIIWILATKSFFLGAPGNRAD